jgi:dUTP pyrophosphatase
VKIKLTQPSAKIPHRANPTDAGADLYSPIDCLIEANSNYFIDLGIQIELPQNTVGLITARSGLGSKNGIRPRNCIGVIDETYRGNLGIMVENASDEDFIIHQGDRIAQLLVMPVEYVTFEEVEELCNTSRGKNGFGSTGLS